MRTGMEGSATRIRFRLGSHTLEVRRFIEAGRSYYWGFFDGGLSVASADAATTVSMMLIRHCRKGQGKDRGGRFGKYR